VTTAAALLRRLEATLARTSRRRSGGAQGQDRLADLILVISPHDERNSQDAPSHLDAASVLVADAPVAVRAVQTLDAQVLEGLATPHGTVQVRQASHAGADPEIAARLADGCAVSVGRALDADPRCRRADRPSAAGAVSVGLARWRAAMRPRAGDRSPDLPASSAPRGAISYAPPCSLRAGRTR
jgi:hypothetical protein